MKRCLFFILFFIQFSFISASAFATNTKELILYVWPDTLSEDVLKDFEKETGIKVKLIIFDSNEVAEAKMLAGEGQYDIIMPTITPFFVREAKLGLFQPLDYKKIPNAKYIDKEMVGYLDQNGIGMTFGIPYYFGTTGFIVNKKKVKEAAPGVDFNFDSYDMLYNVETVKKLKKCGVHLMEGKQDVFVTAMHYLGVSNPEEFELAAIEKAKKMLKQIMPHVRSLESLLDNILQLMINENACIVQSWSGAGLRTKYMAKSMKKDYIQFVIPKEGASVWIDMLAIPKDAPNVENAHIFLNYMLRPDVAAKNSLTLYQATPAQAIKKHLPKDMANDKQFFPSYDILKTFIIPKDFPMRKDRALTRAWQEIQVN